MPRNFAHLFFRPALTLTSLSGLAVLASLASQYLLGLEPCPLCLLLRITFAVLFVAGLACTFLPETRGIQALGLCSGPLAAVLAGLSIGGYHLLLLAGVLGGSCSIAVPLFIGRLSEAFPSWTSFFFDGFGSCTPEMFSAEYWQTLFLLGCSIGLHLFMGLLCIVSANRYLTGQSPSVTDSLHD